MKYNYLILLDYSTGEIIRIKLSEEQKRDSEKYDDFEEYLMTLEDGYGFRLLDCSWMAVERLQETVYGFWHSEQEGRLGPNRSLFLIFFFFLQPKKSSILYIEKEKKVTMIVFWKILKLQVMEFAGGGSMERKWNVIHNWKTKCYKKVCKSSTNA